MYVAMLLSDWSVVVAVSEDEVDHSHSEGDPVRIGRSSVAMWMRVVSSWVCLIIYTVRLAVRVGADRAVVAGGARRFAGPIRLISRSVHRSCTIVRVLSDGDAQRTGEARQTDETEVQ